MDANEKVLSFLKAAGKPKKSSEIAAETGMDKTVVDKALKELKQKGVVSCPKVCYYAPVK